MITFHGSANIVIPDGVEAVGMGPIGIRSDSLDCAIGRTGLLEANVMGFGAVGPAHEQQHMVALTVHGISDCQLVLIYAVGGRVHGLGCESRLGQLPGHGHIARAVHPVPLVSCGLAVWHLLIDPVLSTALHCLSIQALKSLCCKVGSARVRQI